MCVIWLRFARTLTLTFTREATDLRISWGIVARAWPINNSGKLSEIDAIPYLLCETSNLLRLATGVFSRWRVTGSAHWLLVYPYIHNTAKIGAYCTSIGSLRDVLSLFLPRPSPRDFYMVDWALPLSGPAGRCASSAILTSQGERRSSFRLCPLLVELCVDVSLQ